MPSGTSSLIDPRAIIDPQAGLADDVHVGPFSIIGAHVKIGAGTKIGSHVVIKGPTVIGTHNTIYQFASLGDNPQDKKYAGEPTRLEIGDRNVIREYCSINRGTVQGGGVTRIGNDNWIMAYVHIAHDCRIGNQIVFSNAASLAGHVDIADFVILGGFTLVHQFCAIGQYAFTAMGSVISKDVPPYIKVSGHMAKAYGLNVEGLRRQGFSTAVLSELRRAYKVIYKSGFTVEQATDKLAEMAVTCPEVGIMLEFIKHVTRGIIR